MKLLLATDGSSFSAAATQAVIAEVKRDGAEIRAIHVVDAEKESLSQMTATEVMIAAAQRRSAEALVEATAEVLRAEGLKTTTIVDWGDPISKIIEVAKQWGADLIVLGAQGQTGLKRASQTLWPTRPLALSRSREFQRAAERRKT